jgi:hypothetical protein
MENIVLSGEEQEQALSLYEEMMTAKNELSDQMMAITLAKKRFDYMHSRFWSYIAERHPETKGTLCESVLSNGLLTIQEVPARKMPKDLLDLLMGLGGEPT